MRTRHTRQKRLPPPPYCDNCARTLNCVKCEHNISDTETIIADESIDTSADTIIIPNSSDSINDININNILNTSDTISTDILNTILNVTTDSDSLPDLNNINDECGICGEGMAACQENTATIIITSVE